MCKSIGAAPLIGQHSLEFSGGYAMCTADCPPCTAAWVFWKSIPNSSSDSIIIHTPCPGLCINTADLLPFQESHQMIRSAVSGTVSVSNASLSPQKKALCYRAMSADNALWGKGWSPVFRFPVMVDTDDSGPVPAEDHIWCGT